MRYGEKILEIIRSSETHMTAEQVFFTLKQSCPSVVLATVYNNLNSLYQQGKIRKISVEGCPDRYDRNTRHDHLVCRRCGGLLRAVQRRKHIFLQRQLLPPLTQLIDCLIAGNAAQIPFQAAEAHPVRLPPEGEKYVAYHFFYILCRHGRTDQGAYDAAHIAAILIDEFIQRAELSPAQTRQQLFLHVTTSFLELKRPFTPLNHKFFPFGCIF